MLRAFGAVYQTGGIRPAARLLGVTHSSVVRFVHDLEQFVGVPLIDRAEGRRLTRFTAQGEAIGTTVLHAFGQIEQTLLSVREAHRPNSVTIETTPSFAARWLLPRLGDFETRWNWIELSISVDQRLKNPADGHADFAIRLGTGPWPNLDCSPFPDDFLLPVMRTDYWQEAGEPRDCAALKACRLLHDRDPLMSWAHWQKGLGIDEIATTKGARFASSDLVLRAAEQGLGVALARWELARGSIEAGHLIAPIAMSCLPLPNSIWIVSDKDRGHSLAAQTTISWLMELAAERPQPPGGLMAGQI